MRRGNVTLIATCSLAMALAGLVPLLAPAACPAALIFGLAALILAKRRPERFAGRKRATAAILISLAGLGLFVVESSAFLSWKRTQARDQRMHITEDRLARLKEGLEAYFEAHGAYPEADSPEALCLELLPDHLQDCPLRDGWGKPFQVRSRGDAYEIQCLVGGESGHLQGVRNRRIPRTETGPVPVEVSLPAADAPATSGSGSPSDTPAGSADTPSTGPEAPGSRPG